MNNILRVLIDADALVALAHEDDANHSKAIALFAQLEQQSVYFTISNYVLAEVVTVISRKIGHHAAIIFIDEIKSTPKSIDEYWITEGIEQRAIALFKKQTSKNVSFVDCTNMALMDIEGFDALFSFDAIYTKNGYKIVQTAK